MTIEQIKIVNNIKFSIINAIDNIESEQMWGMIEKAYEQKEKEHCEDCISRTELLARIDAERKHLLDIKMDGAEHVIVHHARRIIEDMPSVTPQHTRWIPVSERLPEDRELILFSTKTDEVFEGKYFDGITNSKWYSCRDDTFVWNNVVTAWMPLPEPYKGEKER